MIIYIGGINKETKGVTLDVAKPGKCNAYKQKSIRELNRTLE
jgi:hypothetical protein